MKLEYKFEVDYVVKQIHMEDLDSGETYTVVVNLKIGEKIIEGFLATIVTRNVTKVYNVQTVKWVQDDLPFLSIPIKSSDTGGSFDLPWLMLAKAVIRTYIENEPQPKPIQRSRYERSPVI